MNLFKFCLGLPLLTFSLALPGRAQLEKVPVYTPQPLTMPTGKEYLSPAGEISIVGNDGMEGIVTRFNELFIKTHPDFKIRTVLRGSSTGIPGLTAGVSALAPLARDATSGELQGFQEMFGYAPLDVHIGYSGFGPRDNGKTPPALYMNAKNPLAGLSMEQIARIYTTGNAEGDVTTWGDLGLKGDWKDQFVNIYGLGSGGVLEKIRAVNPKGSLSPNVQAMSNYDTILKLVADDPYSVGLTGWVKPDDEIKSKIKVVPVAGAAGSAFVAPTYENVWAGKFPLSIPLRFYVNRAPGQPLDPFVKEYLRLALSREGQAIINDQKGSEEGYVPLSPDEIAAELAKLN
jgi:phosphate transport system substrate-binding protein